MSFTKSQRLQALPPYLFIEIDRKKRALLAAGKDVINLGVGDPDLPTHKFIIDETAKINRIAVTDNFTPACRAMRYTAQNMPMEKMYLHIAQMNSAFGGENQVNGPNIASVTGGVGNVSLVYGTWCCINGGTTTIQRSKSLT